MSVFWFSSGFGYFDEDGVFHEWSMELDGYPQGDSCNSQGEFILLILADLQLSGFAPSIPPEIALLTSLSYIGLFDNEIEAPFVAMLTPHLLPPKKSSGLNFSEVGGLSSLVYFTLFKNFISGSIPSELGLLTEMEILYIDTNKFSGTICSELGYMTSLEEVSLNDNSLTGTIPSEIGQLTNLKWLELQNLTGLTGSIPSELSLLTSLLYLDLRNNIGLSGILPDELCSLNNGSCTYLDWWGATYNCSLKFECTDKLCGCDCPCNK
jgi:Leucine-rich repeat (LRR) protein